MYASKLYQVWYNDVCFSRKRKSEEVLGGEGAAGKKRKVRLGQLLLVCHCIGLYPQEASGGWENSWTIILHSTRV